MTQQREKSPTRAGANDLVPILLRQVSNQLLFAIVEFRGRLDTPKLEKTIQKIETELPFFVSRLDDTIAWPVWRPITRNTKSIVRTINTRSRTSVFRLIPKLKAATLPSAMQVWILRHPHGDTLCIAVDHALTDAAGLTQLCYLVAATYSHGIGKAKQIVDFCREGSREANILRQLKLFHSIRLLLAWRPARRSWLFPFPRVTCRANPSYSLCHIRPETLRRSQALRKEIGATVNDLLLAALYVAAKTHLEPSRHTPLPIQITVDLRKYSDSTCKPGLANFSSSVYVRLPLNAGGSFKDVLATVRQQTNKLKRNNDALGAAIAVRVLLFAGIRCTRSIFSHYVCNERNSHEANPILSNFGQLDHASLTFQGAAIKHAFLLGPNLLVPGLMMCASGFRGNITLSVGYNRNAMSETLIERIFATMVEELRAAGGH